MVQTREGLKSWIAQRARDVRELGARKSPYVVYWNCPETGKRCQLSCGPGIAGKKAAIRLRAKLHEQIATGTYVDPRAKKKAPSSWKAFVAEYDGNSLAHNSAGNRKEALTALAHFERIVRPAVVADVTPRTIDAYVATRRAEDGQRRGGKVSPATVNKELRHIKAALRKAKRWGHLKEVPDFEFLREPERLPTFITEEHFAAIYRACDQAKRPRRQPYPAADWWRALLVLLNQTGWRISEALSTRWADVDLAAGTIRLAAEKTKGRREEIIGIGPIVVEHLKAIGSFETLVLPWPTSRRMIYAEFYRLQQAAGIHLPCEAEHEHTSTCHLYGFHDERRAFATENAQHLSADVLQRLMRHRSFATTQGYVNIAKRVKDAAPSLHVPAILRESRPAEANAQGSAGVAQPTQSTEERPGPASATA